MFHHMCTKPAFLFKSARQDSLEGTQWKAKYDDHRQLIYGSFQHHWHLKDDEGKRQPLPYCRHKRVKGKQKKE
eukprot:2367975-Karenia_brevis.AAC.1